MTMWVWRLPELDAYCDDDENQKARNFYIRATHPNPQTYANCDFTSAGRGQCRTWIINDIFNQQTLRQGWCGVGLDLKLGNETWVRNWQLIDAQKEALAWVVRRYGIMARLKNIKPRDTIFLPQVGNNQLSENHFTVVTAAGRYIFENRVRENLYWKRDFGNVIPLDGDLTETFSYGSQNLEARDFGPPFISCVVRVEKSHYRGFDEFLKNQDYPFEPYEE